MRSRRKADLRISCQEQCGVYCNPAAAIRRRRPGLHLVNCRGTCLWLGVGLVSLHQSWAPRDSTVSPPDRADFLWSSMRGIGKAQCPRVKSIHRDPFGGSSETNSSDFTPARKLGKYHHRRDSTGAAQRCGLTAFSGKELEICCPFFTDQFCANTDCRIGRGMSPCILVWTSE